MIQDTDTELEDYYDELTQVLKRRLLILEKRRNYLGMDCPEHVIMSIEDIQRKLIALGEDDKIIPLNPSNDEVVNQKNYKSELFDLLKPVLVLFITVCVFVLIFRIASSKEYAFGFSLLTLVIFIKLK